MAEDVIGNEDPLISSLTDDNTDEDKDNSSNTILLPDLQPEPNETEPNYEEMDNLTLLQSLCIHNDSPNVPLLPELD